MRPPPPPPPPDVDTLRRGWEVLEGEDIEEEDRSAPTEQSHGSALRSFLFLFFRTTCT